MNAAEFLIRKSSENNEIAIYAGSKEYYDVTISRHYYSIYQRILFVLYSHVESYNVKKNNGEGSHELAYAEYRKYALKKCKKKLSNDEVTDVAHIDQFLEKIKKFRVDSEYGQKITTQSEFETDFMKKLDKVNEILSKIEPIVKGV